MTSSPAPDLDELERLAEAASKPPWEWAQDDYTGKWVFTGSHGSFEVDTTADAAYIVALVNAAPALLTELRALRAFANWAAQLDDPANPEHRSITLVQIAERAQDLAAPSVPPEPASPEPK